MLLAELLASPAPKLWVLVGSNGAGKSTFFNRFLRSSGLRFVNADEIALTLESETLQERPYLAAQIADAVRRDLIRDRQSFCMETVFSDPQGEKVQWLRDVQQGGYLVVLIWLRIASPALSIARVQQRVESGGHDVPDAKLLERFPRTQRNARAALGFVDAGFVLDNSADEPRFRLVEIWRRGDPQSTG